MPLEEITKKIIEDAKKKRESILKQAEEEKQILISEAKKKAEQIIEEAKKKANEEAKNMITEYETENEINKHDALLVAEDEAAKRELSKVKKYILEEVNKNYKEIIREAVNRIEQEGYGSVIFADEKHISQIKKLGFEATKGDKGVFVKSKDGSISIDITPSSIASMILEKAEGLAIGMMFEESKKGESREKDQKAKEKKKKRMSKR